MSGQIGAAILTARTLDQSAVPAESAFVTAFGLSAVAAALAVVAR